MAKGDTKTNQYLDIAANGTRADLPTDTCCETRSQTLIREVAERIMDVEDEVEEIKNNPDVVDIVATYADLQAYDTQHLTDKDIIRVLQDETHDGESTYYRYNKQSDTWTYVGESKQYEDFVGTDGTAGGQNGLVPAPVATDAGKFLKADGTWDTAGGGSSYTAGDGIDITNDIISATNTGKAKVLTTADYNYPTDNPSFVAAYKLEPGFYYADSGVSVKADKNAAKTIRGGFFVGYENDTVQIVNPGINSASLSVFLVSRTYGYLTNLVVLYGPVDNLTSTDTDKPLSANQGRVLKELIDSIAIRGAGAPTTSTVGTVGKLYEDTTNGKLYICTDTTGGTYTWEEVGAGGGSGPTVVQTTGTSTTDVMSQKATSDMIYVPGYDPVTAPSTWAIGLGKYSYAVAGPSFTVGRADSGNFRTRTFNDLAINILGSDNIGRGSITLGAGSHNSSGDSWNIAIGADASTGGHSTNNVVLGTSAVSAYSANGAIALGSYSSATHTGEMNIGSTNTSYGYNSSNYRLLTGLYDGQSAHDAATVGQITPLTDSSAPTTATVGRLGQIQIDTTTATAYMCVAVDTVTPAYTWKQITA